MLGVFNYIMKECSADGCCIKFEQGESYSYFKRVYYIWFTGQPYLSIVCFVGDIVCFLYNFNIRVIPKL